MSAGLTCFSQVREEAERELFNEARHLRLALENDADDVIIERLMIENYLKHPQDLHGRRRCSVTLELYKVSYPSIHAATVKNLGN